MQDLTLFESLGNYTNIIVKGCSHIVHGCNWSESSMKIDYDLWIILDGEMQVFMNGNEYLLKPHDALLLYPNVPYKAYTVKNECTFIYLHFDFLIGNNNRALDDFLKSVPIPKDEIAHEIDLFIKSYWHFYYREPMSYLQLKGYLAVILSKILLYQSKTNDNLTIEKNPTKSIKHLQQVFFYIEHHLHEKILTKDLAEILKVSEKYFIVIFKKVVGITPGIFIMQMKMNKALDYLYEHKYSIKEISFLLGYSDQYAFSKAFKKYYKKSPSRI